MRKVPLTRKTAMKRNPSKEKGLKKAVKKKKVGQRALMHKADALAQKACVSLGYCEAAEWAKKHGKKCGGCLCWCHIKSRNHRHIRHSPLNCKCMCVACHHYFTEHPDEWVRFIEETDPGRWDFLNERMREAHENNEKPDYAYWIDYYSKREAA